MHKGYTIEEQVTGQSKVGGLQFDVYPRRSVPIGVFHQLATNSTGEGFWHQVENLTATPEELQCELFAFVR
jgi:hypothetical protein